MNYSSPETKSKDGISRFVNLNVAVSLIVIALLFSLFIQFIPLNILSFSDQGPAELYFADSMSPTHKKLIEKFNRKHEGKIKIIPINLPFEKFTTNERKELLARSFRSQNNRIDLFAVDLIWVPRFKKWALPLNRYFSSKDIEKWLPMVAKTCKVEEELVSVPLYLDTGILVYLGSKKTENPSWEALLSDSTNNNQYIFQGKEYEGLMCNFFEIFSTLLPGALPDTILALKQSLEFQKSLLYSYSVSPPEVLNFDEIQSYNYALKNKNVYFRSWFSILGDQALKKRFPEEFKSMSYSVLPTLKGNPAKSTLGGWNLMVSNKTRHPLEAIEFLRFMLSEEAQTLLYDNGKILPVINSFYESLKPEESEFFKKLLSMGVHRPMLVDYTYRSDHIVKLVSQVLHDSLDVESAANSVYTLLYKELK